MIFFDLAFMINVKSDSFLMDKWIKLKSFCKKMWTASQFNNISIPSRRSPASQEPIPCPYSPFFYSPHPIGSPYIEVFSSVLQKACMLRLLSISSSFTPVPPAYFYAAIQKNYAEAMPFTESNPLAGQRLERSIEVSTAAPWGEAQKISRHRPSYSW